MSAPFKPVGNGYGNGYGNGDGNGNGYGTTSPKLRRRAV